MRLFYPVVALLYQNSLKQRSIGKVREWGDRDFQENSVFLYGKEFEGFRRELRGDQYLKKERMKGFGHRDFYRSVGDNYAAVGREGVCGQRFFISLYQGWVGGAAAGVVVFDDGHRGFAKVADERQGGFDIQ